jgi:hypothetical protein
VLRMVDQWSLSSQRDVLLTDANVLKQDKGKFRELVVKSMASVGYAVEHSSNISTTAL